MEIESDQLVDDYLSRVGDLAQQRQLPPSDSARLVSTLRNEIDRRRATYGEESPAAVRGILGALGTPDEVVERAEDGTPVPPPRSEGPGPGPVRPRRPSPPSPKPSRSSTPKPSRSPSPSASKPSPSASKPSRSPSPKPSASSSPVPTPRKGDELPGAGAGMDPDWWRTDALNATDIDVTDGLPGFVGGIEMPELFEPPAPEADEEPEDEEAAPGRWRRVARVVLRRKAAPAPGQEAEADEEPAAAPARPRLANPFLLLAALLLVGGAVFGSLVALAAGWLLAYASRRLTPGEVKGAVLVVPGLAAATGVVWLWGRVEGRWGDPVGPGGEAMSAAIAETWPWVLRGAAVASALFLLWRSRRH
ncbi:hypothetical protein ACFXGT_23680 [Streptomyces sp. NPDC059352]|uniref:hypothetical protein n=1 Tax=Streptomyces sp. NPDC059352 TaxID=3346810 RepID=UPI0036BE09AA